jgi:hypothetical protein
VNSSWAGMKMHSEQDTAAVSSAVHVQEQVWGGQCTICLYPTFKKGLPKFCECLTDTDIHNWARDHHQAVHGLRHKKIHYSLCHAITSFSPVGDHYASEGIERLHCTINGVTKQIMEIALQLVRRTLRPRTLWPTTVRILNLPDSSDTEAPH